MQVPGGMDIFARAREASVRWPGMRIVVCSACPKPESGQMPEDARFRDKPYRGELVMHLLHEMGLAA